MKKTCHCANDTTLRREARRNSLSGSSNAKFFFILMMRRYCWRIAMAATHLGLAATGAWTSIAHAQNYPERPIRLVVPYGAGSSTDIQARQMSPKMGELLGQPIVVDDRPGGGAIIGTEMVAKAAPDGYTLLLGSSGTHAINKHLFKSLPYDPISSFTPIARIAYLTYVLVVNSKSPLKTVSDLVTFAKSRPGQLNYGSIAIGSTMHLAGELFNTEAGIKISHIPYKAPSQVITDLLSGELTLMFYPYAPLASQIQSGALRVLSTTGPERASFLPQAPTMVESGFPGFVLTSWLGVYGPANMPARTVSTLYSAIRQTMTDPDVVKRMTSVGSDVYLAGPEEFGKFTQFEIDRLKRIVEISGAKPD